MTNMTDQLFGSAGRFWLLSLAWLPAGIVVVSLLLALSRPASPEMALTPAALLSLAPAVPCGLPLALACRGIWRTGSTRVAWISFAILAPLSSFAALVGGLLGPIGIAIHTAVLSAPAWIAYAVVRGRRSPR